MVKKEREGVGQAPETAVVCISPDLDDDHRDVNSVIERVSPSSSLGAFRPMAILLQRGARHLDCRDVVGGRSRPATPLTVELRLS